MDAALETARLSPFDPEAAPWPYADEAPTGERRRWGNITYVNPDPSTGLGVGVATGDGFSSPGPQCSQSVILANWRSIMPINACTGEDSPETTNVALEDAEAFQRFLEAVEIVP